MKEKQEALMERAESIITWLEELREDYTKLMRNRRVISEGKVTLYDDDGVTVWKTYEFPDITDITGIKL